MNKRYSLYSFINFALFFAVCATLFAAVHFFTSSSDHALKKNRYETVLTSRENVAQWLSQAAGVYFFKRYMPTWSQGIQPDRDERKNQRKVLNYTLDIEHIRDTNPAHVIDPRHPTIYLHGWGDTKNSAKLLKAFCDVLPGDLITFNFRDSGVILAKIGYSNLGQLPDVLSTLYVLNWTKNNVDPHAIDLYGYSRGGATLLNTLAVLNDTTGHYDTALEAIGISPTDRTEILDLIQKGSHVLDCPLTDMNVSINENVKHRKLADPQEKESFWVKAFERLTRYKHDGLQGLNSAQKLDGLDLNMLLHFQHRDTIVSNKNEAELYNRLRAHNPNSTYMVLGDDGGHLHSHATLANALHTFKKRYGGSYDPHYVEQYAAIQHKLHPANRLSRPGMQAQAIIDHYYRTQAEKAAQAQK